MKLPIALAAGLALAACTRSPDLPQTRNTGSLQNVQTAGAGKGTAQEVAVTSASPEARTQFFRGRDFVDNVHFAEATAALQKAVEVDPKFASAHALLATLLPPAQAKEHVDIALANSAGLPEDERTEIEALAAFVQGDNDRLRELRLRLAELAPGDWRTHHQLGILWSGDRNWDKAVPEFEKAIALNPKAGTAYNYLGYAYLIQEKHEESAASFRKYAEVAPDEANAPDSLGEVLMAGGHLVEAEAQFQKALAIQPRFAGAWTGIAETRYLRGDWAGGDEALAREKDVDVRPQAVVNAEASAALAQLAQGKGAECWRRLDQAVAAARENRLAQEFTLASLQARLRGREGDSAESVRRASAVLEGAEKSDLPAGPKANVRRLALLEVVRAQALAKDGAGAGKSLAALEEAVKPVARVAFFASALENARGLAALARGDASEAIAAMRKCVRTDFNCQYDLIQAQESVGDRAGAAATRDALLKRPVRAIEYVYIWKKLGGQPGAPRVALPGQRAGMPAN